MKNYSKLQRYPLGSIRAKGFLMDQMLLGKDGICGHLHELEPEMIAKPFVEKAYVPAWTNGNQEGWGAEISGNYWTGYIQFAYTLNDAEMIKTATEWVETMMKNQRADGYLGTYYENDAKIYDDYNAWGTACAMRGLLAFYEATGRTDVLNAVHRCLVWFCDTWTDDKKTCYAAPYIIDPMIQTYFYTGDERLVKFSEEFLEFVCNHDIFHTSYKAMLTEALQYNTSHTAGLGCQVRLPALVYSVTGKTDYLNATAKRLAEVMEKSTQITGSPVSDNEYLSPVSSTGETEYCCYAFFNQTYSHMSYITGETKYGDMMEQLFYNGAQGARKKDEKAIAYFTTPNQVYATEFSSATHQDAQAYAPCYPTSCCPVNAVTVIPEFIRGMILKDESDNAYVMAYGPCSLDHNGISFELKTYYPFRNKVAIEINSEKKFTLNLKIPAWSKGYTVKVNGEECLARVKDGFAQLSREWKRGDVAEISFNAVIEKVIIDDSDGPGKHPIAIKYGALVFSYHIPEIWKTTKGRPMTPLPEGWSWYNVYPQFEEAAAEDAHEMLGLRRQQISWNIALDENLTAEDFEIEEISPTGYAWSNPMIKLHTHCYKAPYMTPPYPQTTYETYGAYQEVSEKLPLTLEPYGCTNLRITYFPKAKLK